MNRRFGFPSVLDGCRAAYPNFSIFVSSDEFARYLAVFGVTRCLRASSLPRSYTRNVARHCEPFGFRVDRFLAYCENLTFGDYEHGASGTILNPKLFKYEEGGRSISWKQQNSVRLFR